MCQLYQQSDYGFRISKDPLQTPNPLQDRQKSKTVYSLSLYHLKDDLGINQQNDSDNFYKYVTTHGF